MASDEFNCGCVRAIRPPIDFHNQAVIRTGITANTDCPDCGGTGKRKPQTKPCPICQGHGRIWIGEHRDGPLDIEKRGDGTTLIRATGSRPDEKECPACKGEGTVPKDACWLSLETMEVSANIHAIGGFIITPTPKPGFAEESEARAWLASHREFALGENHTGGWRWRVSLRQSDKKFYTDANGDTAKEAIEVLRSKIEPGWREK